MRLKYFFFPIILVISLSIAIGFIWPEIDKVVKANEGKMATENELKAIKEQQVAIELIGKKVSADVEGEKMIDEYLPSNKVEDRIIGGVNYLATDANVSLVNITLEDNNSLPGLADIPVKDAAGNPVIAKESPLKSTTAKISVSGEYEKIRIFLDNLQRISMLNTIKSITIVKREIAEADAASESNSGLNVEIIADFGYLAVTKIDSKQIEKIDASVDEKTIELLNKYISQKSRLINIGNSDAGAKGKTNPFLTN